MSTQRAQGVLLFLVLAVNSTCFEFYVVTRSYSSHPFLCALGQYNSLGAEARVEVSATQELQCQETH